MKKIFKFFLNKIPRPLLIKASYAVRPAIALYYRGDCYEDPIDGRTFRSFLPYGYVNVRENVLSPSTLSLERHRLLWLYLQRELKIFDKKIDLLHFAPEQCFYDRFRESANINYLTTDLNSPLADVHADICNLPFEGDSYDLILCNHVLEHIPDDETAMREIYRVLKPGGTAILQIPLDMSREVTYEDDSITDRDERERIFGQYDHVRVYGMDYFERLDSIGFKVDAVDYTKTLTADQIDRYRLAPGELIPVVRKPITEA
ncbi:class I SAM-dependent methyltransferase [Nonlabens ponticola]|uniref:Class I SAM-dependent methyltransferase n=1 Tax=Nonlabens ponticola TaxID=2496866 RepID=A0A3S9MUE7_9FLAO|nr:class I SAM-dependent methyltransferase [Nonlabens ponticola]AZQ42770.1 class I SAM-dependent methyltransferase [Nonlabens ponticola]